jgi:hypothetical protein
LHELLTVWVLRQLGGIPGYTIERKKWRKRRGRKRILDEDELKVLLMAYNNCRRQLQNHGKGFLKRLRPEGAIKFRSRIADALMGLNLPAVFDAPPLSPKIAVRLVHESEGKYGINLDPLIMNFLAYMAGGTYGQMRGHIQRAEEKWPELHIRRSDAERR